MKHSLRHRYRQGSKAGFTIAELMAVIVVSGLTTSFIFFLFIDQSRLAQTQAQIGELQTSLQFAVSSLQRDIRRAGFMSILTNADRRLCQVYNANDFNAFNYTNANTALFQPGSSNPNTNIAPDSLELFGNYMTTADFPAYVDPSSPGTIVVNFAGSSITNATSFQRAFFSPNQLLMIKGQTGRLHIVQVRVNGPAAGAYNATSNTARLPISSSLPLRNTTNCGVAIRFRVAPLHKIRYRMFIDPTTRAWQLRREVMNPGRCTPTGCTWSVMGANTPHPPLVIAPFAVDLQFWFSTWNNTTNEPSHLDPRCTGTNVSTCISQAKVASTHDDTVSHWPPDSALIRSVFFRVTVRTQNEDPSLAFQARPNTLSTISTYDVDPNTQGAARVRSIVKNVMIPNMLAR